MPTGTVPLNIEDCYTACAALQEGITELLKTPVIKAQIGETAQFVALGGTAIAAITSPFLPAESLALLLFNDIFRRQTKDVDVELKCNVENDVLANLLAEVYKKFGTLPTHPGLSSPGGIFAPSSNGFVLNRNKIVPGNDPVTNKPLPPIDRPGTVQYPPVEFDAHNASNTRLRFFIHPGTMFDAANVTEYKGRAVSFKILKAPLLLLLKLCSFFGRHENHPQKACADFVDVRLLLTLADKLGINRAAFDRFRAFVPPNQQAQGCYTINQLANNLATFVENNGQAKDAGKTLATELVEFEIKERYYFWNPKPKAQETAEEVKERMKDAAKALWIGYFKQLYDLLKA